MRWRLPNVNPYRVQEEARLRAKGRRGFLYHLEMGLGKTYVALDEFIEILDEKRAEAMVVLCPNSLKETWADAIEAAGVAHRAQIVTAPRVPTTFNCIWMFNYEALIYDSTWEPLYGLVRQGGVHVIADESTRIKNFQASTTKRALTLTTEAVSTRALTGMAMVQNVMDLWSQLRFIGELRGFNQYAFRARYALRGGYLGRQVVGIREENRAELDRILEGCSFRARKEDWLDLPAKSYTTRHVKLSPRQEQLYKRISEDLVLLLEDGSQVQAPMVISLLLKLQQISSGFVINDERKAVTLVESGSNPRLKEALQVVEDATGKVLIFAQFTHSIKLLLEALLKRWNGEAIFGGMKDGEVRDAVKRFNTDPAKKFMVAQLSTGGIGHTLIGSVGKETRCATVLFYEQNFRLGDRMQAEDRAHRIGQDVGVLYVDLVSSKIDTHIITALQKKKGIIELLIDKKEYLT